MLSGSPFPHVPPGHELHVWISGSNPKGCIIMVFEHGLGSGDGYLHFVDFTGSPFQVHMTGILRMEGVNPALIVEISPSSIPKPEHNKELLLKVRYTWGYGFLRFTCVGYEGEDLEWRDDLGNPPSAYKVVECEVVWLPAKNPQWQRDTPGDQARVLIDATQGWLSNLEDGTTNARDAIVFMRGHLDELQALVPFLEGKGEW